MILISLSLDACGVKSIRWHAALAAWFLDDRPQSAAQLGRVSRATVHSTTRLATARDGAADGPIPLSASCVRARRAIEMAGVATVLPRRRPARKAAWAAEGLHPSSPTGQSFSPSCIAPLDCPEESICFRIGEHFGLRDDRLTNRLAYAHAFCLHGPVDRGCRRG